MQEQQGLEVLVVDDEPYAMEIAVNSVDWKKYSARAYSATSAKEALELLEAHRIQVVITDIKMPDMDGLTLIRKINELDRGIICIVMSSFNDFDLVREAMKLGACDYLFKPTMMPEDIENAVFDTVKKRDTGKTAVFPERSLADERWLADLYRYIDDNLMDHSLSLASAAEHAGLSRSYFSKHFKEVSGMKFVDCITKKKLEKARELYCKTGMKIYEIAEKLGYADWHYLYALYKREYGHSLSKEKR